MPQQCQPDQPPVPLWEVHARPLDEPGGAWETRRVRAASIPEAQEIMRRRSLEIAPGSAMLIEGDRDAFHATASALRPLACTRCGYPLAGLTLDCASVTCTECAHPQALVVHQPIDRRRLDRAHPLIGIFAFIGMLFVLLLALLLIIPLVGVLR